jgi:hypothetical protein
MTDSVTFTTTDATKKVIPTLSGMWESIAFEQAKELVDTGQSPREATSCVAHIMIENAWIVAGCGVVADGGTPDKDRFRAVVEAVLERIVFGGSSDEISPEGSET